jgi:phage baseplate assembly protein W
VSGPRYRAWRFWHPDIESSARFAGLALTSRGGVEMVEESDSIRQAIYILITTIPGERVMRPDYGCLVHRLAFSPNDDTTAGLGIHYVRQALERWEPRIEIVRLDAGRNPDLPEMLDLVLDYRVKATRQLDSLNFSFSLSGAAS